MLYSFFFFNYFFIFFTANVKTPIEFFKVLKINISYAEIKIKHTSGEQCCPLISGLQPDLRVLSTTTSWLLRKRNVPLDYSQKHVLDRYRHAVAEYSNRFPTI